MIRLMCTENATQRGALAAVVLNEVAAATRRLAGILLRGDTSGIPEVWANQKAFGTARGHLEHGDGIGEPIIAGGTFQDISQICETCPDVFDSVKAAGTARGNLESCRPGMTWPSGRGGRGVGDQRAVLDVPIRWPRSFK
jgi:hypothetical protein